MATASAKRVMLTTQEESALSAHPFPMASSSTNIALSALVVSSTTAIMAADALKAKFSKDLSASVNVRLMRSLTPMETVSLVEPTRSSPTDSVSAKPDMLSTAAEFALFLAPLATSPSWEDAPSVPLTPSSRQKSTAADAPQVSTRTTSVSVPELS